VSLSGLAGGGGAAGGAIQHCRHHRTALVIIPPSSLIIPCHLLTIPPSLLPLVIPSLAVFLIFQYLLSTLRAVAHSGGGWAGSIGCLYYPWGGGSFMLAPIVNSS